MARGGAKGVVCEPGDPVHVQWRGQRMLYFGGCDYLGLALEPTVIQALRRGAKQFGLGVSASRTTTGDHPLYRRLEGRLARYFGSESSLLVSGGYLTAQAAAARFAGEADRVLLDEDAHSCLVEAASTLGVPIRRYRHCDPRHLRLLVAGTGRQRRSRRPLLMTDSVFALTGDLAPIPELIASLPVEGGYLIDDSHGAGVLGRRGQGVNESLADCRGGGIVTTTLSKGMGVFGGLLLGARNDLACVRQRAGSFGGATPIPLALAIAVDASLDWHGRWPVRERRAYHDRVCEFKQRARAAGYPVSEGPAPIMAIRPGDEATRRRLHRSLVRRKVFPSWIEYPSGSGRGCFRFAIQRLHGAAALDRLAAALGAS